MCVYIYIYMYIGLPTNQREIHTNTLSLSGYHPPGSPERECTYVSLSLHLYISFCLLADAFSCQP